MPYWIYLFFILVLVSAKPRDDADDEEDRCAAINCRGKQYTCINGQCYCANGYMPNAQQNRCVRCPGYGDKCTGSCCNSYSNGTLQCFMGICQRCYDSNGNWICHDSIDHILLISTTQVIMATALVLGIIATFVLLYKLCAATNIRPLGGRSSPDSRLSIGSLQVYVEERLRDAPPRYSRTLPSDAPVYPATVYSNAGFIHDTSIPPPPYTPNKEENEAPTVHM